MHREELEQRIIAEQAAQWLGDLRGADDARQQEFLAWLRRSPRHLKEFLYAETVWQELSQLPIERVDLEALIARARSEPDGSNVVRLEPEEASKSTDAQLERRSTSPLHKRSRLAIAAGLALAASGASYWAWMSTSSAYVTRIGEQRSVRLPDGSIMQLNTHSRAEVRYSQSAREIELLEGEALFTAQKDVARPFRVRAGRSVIQALGTQFNVYRTERDIKVAVISGAVQITPASTAATAQPGAMRLDAGQEARVTSSGGRISHTKAEVADAVAWRERRLVFRGETLESVAAEFNRYNERQIRVEGQAARRKQLSGTFDADDTRSLMQFLRRLEDVRVEETQDEVIIRAADEDMR